MPEFLTTKQLARRWGCSHKTLERWRGEGRGPAFHRLGSGVAYRASDVAAYEATRRSQPAPLARAA